MRLIVNADDLGISNQVNGAIFSLIDDGLVTSSTILANGPAVGEVLRSLPQLQNASLGAHLNLTQFESMTQHPGLRGILDRDGHFIHRQIRKVSPYPNLLKGVYKEWLAQIRYLQRNGVPLTHIDSHHHVHTIPMLFPVLKAVQVATGIRRVRRPKNLFATRPKSFFAPGGRYHALEVMKANLWNWALRVTTPTSTTDAFTNFRELVSIVEQRQLPRSIGSSSVIEAMVHPGHPNYYSETMQLNRAWIEQNNATLVNFGDI